MSLKISRTLELPTDYVTQPGAILAMRGAGKSNTAVKTAEEMHKAKLPFVVIDPKGDWWGIRSSRDGKKPGLPIPVFGGLHGDVPLEAGMGAEMAEIIVELNLTCVLDVSEFDSKNDQIRFLTEFAKRLFRLHGRDRSARHIFMEEADEYVPQKFQGALMPACVGAWTKIVKQGRQRGLGITLISQRAQVVNKDALTQIETLIAMRVTHKLDREAIRGWVEYHAVSKELIESLSTLDDGEAWVVSPHWLKRTERVKFLQRATYDSGATPEHGTTNRAPANLADVDLAALGQRMEAAVEKAKENDPTQLKAELARLRTEVARVAPFEEAFHSLQAEHGKLATQFDELKAHSPSKLFVQEKPVIPPMVEELCNELASIGDRIRDEGVVLIQRGVELGQKLMEIDTDLQEPREVEQEKPVLPPIPTVRAEDLPEIRMTPPAPKPPPMRLGTGDPDPQLGKNGAPRKILIVLAQRQSRGPMSMQRIATLAGYSLKGGGFQNAIYKLRGLGYIEGQGEFTITPAGVQALGEYETLPTGRALVDWWKSKKGIGKAHKAILDALVAVYPNTLTMEEIAEQTDYSLQGGGFQNALYRLSALELIDGGKGSPWKASDDFFA